MQRRGVLWQGPPHTHGRTVISTATRSKRDHTHMRAQANGARVGRFPQRTASRADCVKRPVAPRRGAWCCCRSKRLRAPIRSPRRTSKNPATHTSHSATQSVRKAHRHRAPLRRGGATHRVARGCRPRLPGQTCRPSLPSGTLCAVTQVASVNKACMARRQRLRTQTLHAWQHRGAPVCCKRRVGTADHSRRAAGTIDDLKRDAALLGRQQRERQARVRACTRASRHSRGAHPHSRTASARYWFSCSTGHLTGNQAVRTGEKEKGWSTVDGWSGDSPHHRMRTCAQHSPVKARQQRAGSVVKCAAGGAPFGWRSGSTRTSTFPGSGGLAVGSHSMPLTTTSASPCSLPSTRGGSAVPTVTTDAGAPRARRMLSSPAPPPMRYSCTLELARWAPHSAAACFHDPCACRGAHSLGSRACPRARCCWFARVMRAHKDSALNYLIF